MRAVVEELERAKRRHVALKWGVTAGVVSGVALVLVRVLVISEIALLVAFVSPSPRAARLAERAAWVALKCPAYPFIGERSLDSGFDLGVVALGLAIHFGVAVAFGASFGRAALGRSSPATVALGVLWGIAGFLLETYVLSHVTGGGLAANPGVAVVFLVYGLILAAAFLRSERGRRATARR